MGNSGNFGPGTAFLSEFSVVSGITQEDIVVNWSAIGLWARMNDASWQKLNNSSPDQMVIADIDGNGVDDIIADFSSTFGGIFVKRNQGVWNKLHNFNLDSLATGNLDKN